jgi:3-phenylpropionate/trans-cinnamate dioxygenase ferredoxin reductase component
VTPPARAPRHAACVIVGAGQAGSELAFALRQGGAEGSITIVGDEPHQPYQRPPLSKALLSGRLTAHELRVRADTAYQTAQIDLRLGKTITRVDRQLGRVFLTDGTSLPYDKLAFTTGGRPRPLDIGQAGGVVSSLYSLEDAERLRGSLVAGARLLIVGGGFVGLEVAACAVRAGAHVTLVEAQHRLLARTCAAQIAGHFERTHREQGVDVRLATGLRSVTADGDGAIVELSDGTRIPV